MRIRLDLGYDGAGFAGWARQPAQRTVQGCLEEALARVLAVPAVSVTCAGRTDAGVHASGQVVHADVTTGGLDPASLVRRLNGVLPDDLRVRGCVEAAAGFDARFAALWRRYRYQVCDQGAVDPLRRGQVLRWRRPVDVEAMNEAASQLVGLHDFVAYCRPRPGATTLRHLHELDWRRDDAGLAVLTVRADAFCHRMVRSLTGALLVVGEGRQPVDWPAEVLRAARRDSAVPVVPAHGLMLTEVGYPPDAELAQRAERTRRRRVRT